MGICTKLSQVVEPHRFILNVKSVKKSPAVQGFHFHFYFFFFAAGFLAAGFFAAAFFAGFAFAGILFPSL